MNPVDPETLLNERPQSADEPKAIFPRLALTDETDSSDVSPASRFESILDAYEKEPDRWDGLE